MATETFTHEFHTSIAPEKAFKCFIVDMAKTFPKIIPNAINSIENEPNGIMKINLANGGKFKVKFDTVDTQNKICKFTIIEGEYQGNKVNESITVEEKFEPSNNGGCVIKTKTNFCPMAAQNYPKTALNATGEIMAQGMSMFKAAEAFVLANPAICA
ncbi:hypothetical protein M9H77_28422 [Catharanthus roseus]|uniref:Uncharacterized protein n=1 Tax=Catharanthus roseus TaxID=4058 RepID=A0ACC0AG86_CATRO|nr:hypothetical protein M9H77_28422 [Catharanthus roseus]